MYIRRPLADGLLKNQVDNLDYRRVGINGEALRDLTGTSAPRLVSRFEVAENVGNS